MYEIAQNYDALDNWTKLYDIHEVMPRDWKYAPFWRMYCTAFMRICELIEYEFISHNPLADDPDRFNVYIDHEPNGTSMQSVMMFA
ncbi:MAG: hypothetical protein ACK56F_13320 [bacterium]